jgi:hypothetical protein
MPGDVMSLPNSESPRPNARLLAQPWTHVFTSMEDVGPRPLVEYRLSIPPGMEKIAARHVKTQPNLTLMIAQ